MHVSQGKIGFGGIHVNTVSQTLEGLGFYPHRCGHVLERGESTEYFLPWLFLKNGKKKRRLSHKKSAFLERMFVTGIHIYFLEQKERLIEGPASCFLTHVPILSTLRISEHRCLLQARVLSLLQVLRTTSPRDNN